MDYNAYLLLSKFILVLMFEYLQKVYYADEGFSNAVCCFTCLPETSQQSMNCDGSLEIAAANWFVFIIKMVNCDLENC